MVNFQVFVPLNKFLVANLSETHAFTSKKHEAERSINIQNYSETIRLLWSHSSSLAFGK